jgi:hypothetical protein
MIHALPTFRELVAHFPDHTKYPTPKLLNEIGGQIRLRLNDADNTCAIRLSHTLNKSGAPLKVVPAPHFLKAAPHVVPGTEHHAHPAHKEDLYIYRVLEMKDYLIKRDGKGVRIYNGHKATHFTEPPPIKGATQGIIAFEWQGPFNQFNASGHMDLYRGLLTGNPQALGANCIGACYFNAGPMIADFWEVRP